MLQGFVVSAVVELLDVVHPVGRHHTLNRNMPCAKRVDDLVRGPVACPAGDQFVEVVV
jgi:hypothetical protein